MLKKKPTKNVRLFQSRRMFFFFSFRYSSLWFSSQHCLAEEEREHLVLAAHKKLQQQKLWITHCHVNGAVKQVMHGGELEKNACVVTLFFFMKLCVPHVK